MKRAIYVLVACIIVVVLVKGYYWKQDSSTNIPELQLQMAQKEKKAATPTGLKPDAAQSLKIPPDSKPLEDILVTSQDVKNEDGTVIRGQNNPFNTKFQTDQDIETYVDSRMKALKIDVNTDQKKSIMEARRKELTTDKIDYGSSVDVLLMQFRDRNNSTSQTNREKTAIPDLPADFTTVTK